MSAAVVHDKPEWCRFELCASGTGPWPCIYHRNRNEARERRRLQREDDHALPY